MANKTLNKFDAMVKPVATEKKKDKKDSMPRMDLDVSIVDSYIDASMKLDEATLKVAEKAKVIRETFDGFYLKVAKEGNFTKSARSFGKNEEQSIRVTKTNRFTLTGLIDELKTVDENFDNHFEEERVVSVKKAVFESESMLKKFMAKFTAEEIAEFFDIKYLAKAKKDFDKEFAEMPEAKRKKLAELISQAQAGIVID